MDLLMAMHLFLTHCGQVLESGALHGTRICPLCTCTKCPPVTRSALLLVKWMEICAIFMLH